MPNTVPSIDPKSYEDIVEETESLAAHYSDWQPPPDGEMDLGRTIIHIFSRMAMLIIERINKTPEKNFLAFLNLIGARLKAPMPARVPLTFLLAKGSPDNGVRIPARTRVAALPLEGEGEGEEINFETEIDLWATTAELESVFVRDPHEDCWGNFSGQATGQTEDSFTAFSGSEQIEHSLRLFDEEFLRLSDRKTIILRIFSSNAQSLQRLPILWEYCDGENWMVWNSGEVSSEVLNYAALGSYLKVELKGIPITKQQTADGLEKGWIRARLDCPLPPVRGDLLPDAAYSGSNRLDLSEPFSPFADPGGYLGKNFYLNIESAFRRSYSIVLMDVSLFQAGSADSTLILSWQFWDGNNWIEFQRSGPSNSNLGSGGNPYLFYDNTLGFTRDGLIHFVNPSNWQPRTLWGLNGMWLRVEIIPGSGDYTTLPIINSLTASYEWHQVHIKYITYSIGATNQHLAPDLGFVNTQPIDFTKDFFPFGEKPKFNDTLFISNEEVFSKPGAHVRMIVNLSNPQSLANPPIPAVNPSDLEIVLEVWNGEDWETLSVYQSGTTNEVDITNAFITGLDFRFQLPDIKGECEINGQNGFWIRARITKGNFGSDPQYALVIDTNGDPILDSNGNFTYTLEAEPYGPPLISIMDIYYTFISSEKTLTACHAYNDFQNIDYTADASDDTTFFQPFTSMRDERPSLYLGFRGSLPINRLLALFFQVEEALYEEDMGSNTKAAFIADPARLVWEYTNPQGWARLGVEDESIAFTKRGLISFIGPTDFEEREDYNLGKTSRWLRVRWEEGVFTAPVCLRAVLTNTIWSSHSMTIEREVLGSSDGRPEQVFHITQVPVLEGQQIEVREREEPKNADKVDIEAIEGDNAITIIRSVTGQPQEVWVRWHAVSDFYESKAQDRHYVFDPMTGEVRFGDGQHGMVPNTGHNNVRARIYQTGGGKRGNRSTGSITQLKSAVPYVDGVTNYEPSEGGADRETLESAKKREPRRLRHRDRSVADQDFEDLATEASPDVARTLAIGTRNQDDAGEVTLVIVPHDNSPRPIPSLGLLFVVEDFIRERCTPTVSLNIVGPDWAEVVVDVQIVPVSLDIAEAVETAVDEALCNFLHPLTGGPDGQGWSFGRKPYESDLHALIEAVEGVDYVHILSVMVDEASISNRSLVFSGTHTIHLIRSNPGS